MARRPRPLSFASCARSWASRPASPAWRHSPLQATPIRRSTCSCRFTCAGRGRGTLPLEKARKSNGFAPTACRITRCHRQTCHCYPCSGTCLAEIAGKTDGRRVLRSVVNKIVLAYYVNGASIADHDSGISG